MSALYIEAIIIIIIVIVIAITITQSSTAIYPRLVTSGTQICLISILKHEDDRSHNSLLCISKHIFLDYTWILSLMGNFGETDSQLSGLYFHKESEKRVYWHRGRAWYKVEYHSCVSSYKVSQGQDTVGESNTATNN